jgi:hypothetical protein
LNLCRTMVCKIPELDTVRFHTVQLQAGDISRDGGVVTNRTLSIQRCKELRGFLAPGLRRVQSRPCSSLRSLFPSYSRVKHKAWTLPGNEDASQRSGCPISLCSWPTAVRRPLSLSSRSNGACMVADQSSSRVGQDRPVDIDVWIVGNRLSCVGAQAHLDYLSPVAFTHRYYLSQLAA